MQLLKNFSPLFTQKYSGQQSKVPYLVYKPSYTLSQVLKAQLNPQQTPLFTGLGAGQHCPSPPRTLFLASPAERHDFWPIPIAPGPAPGQSHPAAGYINFHTPPPFSGLPFCLVYGGFCSFWCDLQQPGWVGLQQKPGWPQRSGDLNSYKL